MSGDRPPHERDSDSEFTANDPESIAGVIEHSGSARRRFGGAGYEVEEDVVIMVDPSEPTQEIDGTGHDRPASEIVDVGGDGDRYRVVRVVDDGSGVLLLQSEYLDE